MKKILLFLILFTALQAEFDPLTEFPNATQIGTINQNRIKLGFYDLLVSSAPLTEVDGLEMVIQWSPNGYLECDPCALTPLLKILLNFGKKGYITESGSSQLVFWRQDLHSLPSPSKFILDLPQDKLTLAVYVAKSAIISSLQYPPDSFYVNEIKRIHDLFDKKPMYVSIYTEGATTLALCKKYDKMIHRPNITFAPGTSFHAIAEHDCFIHNVGEFPVGEYRIEVEPLHCSFEHNIATIDRVHLKFNP